MRGGRGEAGGALVVGSILPSQPVHHQIPCSPLPPPHPSGELCQKAAPHSSPVGETILSHPRFPCKAPRGNPAPRFFWDHWLPSRPPRFALPALLPAASRGCPAPSASPGQCSSPSSPTAPGCPLQTILGLQGARGWMDVPLGPVGREKRDGWGASGWAHEPTRLPVGAMLVAGMCVRMGSGGTCCALAAAHSPGSSCVCVCLSGRDVEPGQEGKFGN